MPRNYWMLVMTREQFEATRNTGFRLVGLKLRQRKKAQLMTPGDRIVFYVPEGRVFTGTATVTSTFFEDHTPIWRNPHDPTEDYPWRVHIQANAVLREDEYLDANQIAPRLLYVKRWPPEMWPLAFLGNVHLLPGADFRLLEAEMQRNISRRRGGRQGTGPPAGGEAEPAPHTQVS